MFIRAYQPDDCRKLAELFYHTVHTVNAGDYTEEQLDAWAAGDVDLEMWNRSFQEHYSVVAVEGDTIIGFGEKRRCRCHLQQAGAGRFRENHYPCFDYGKALF